MKSCWVQWERLFMGMKPSPYNAVRFYYWAEDFIRGDRRCPTNPMQWDFIRLNLPGSADYDSSLPWVMKWRIDINGIAGDFIVYIDDVRVVGFSLENCWQVMRRAAAQLQYLSQQDASRKRRAPSKTPGAWAGTGRRSRTSRV